MSELFLVLAMAVAILITFNHMNGIGFTFLDPYIKVMVAVCTVLGALFVIFIIAQLVKARKKKKRIKGGGRRK